MGAQIAGYAGEKIADLGRITGLDPAGHHYNDMPTFVRLDPSDAVFVDNIHTNGYKIYPLYLGTYQPDGHLDFFVNGGREQPGCSLIEEFLELLYIDVDVKGSTFCNHLRAILYFVSSLTDGHDFLGHECADYETFKEGDCGSCGTDNSKCAYMGLRADEYPFKSRELVKMYLDTGSQDPFFEYNYQIRVKTKDKTALTSYAVTGKLFVTLIGENGKETTRTAVTSEFEKFPRGSTRGFVFTDKTDVGKVSRVILEWKAVPSPLRLLMQRITGIDYSSLIVNSAEVSPLTYYPESKRTEHTVEVCGPQSATLVKNGQAVTFTSSNC